MKSLLTLWRQSKIWRFMVTGSIAYVLLRLVVHGLFLSLLLFPGQGPLGDLPAWTESQEAMVPADLQIYLNAAKNFRSRQGLYLQGSLARLEDHFPYAPSFALAFIPFLWLSPVAVTIVHTVLHFVALLLLYFCWGQIFKQLNLERAVQILPWTIPVWLLFSSFWTDLSYLNIYIVMALIGTLLIRAIINEQLGGAVLYLALVLQIKPHWAFAAVVPLLLGRYRFFFKLMVWTLVAYLLTTGIVILVASPAYGWQQYIDYVRFLARLSRDFPWRGPDSGFLGYNHSIVQIIVYVFGVSSISMRWATIAKAALLVPLVLTAVRYLIYPIRCVGRNVPQVALDLAFVFYLGAFIWLDMVWELSLGLGIFVYLLATLNGRIERVVTGVVFLFYALLDPWRVISFVVGRMDVILPGPYVATDPAIYVPLIMIVILTFYALLLYRLWRVPLKSWQGAQA